MARASSYFNLRTSSSWILSTSSLFFLVKSTAFLSACLLYSFLEISLLYYSHFSVYKILLQFIDLSVQLFDFSNIGTISMSLRLSGKLFTELSQIFVLSSQRLNIGFSLFNQRSKLVNFILVVGIQLNQFTNLGLISSLFRAISDGKFLNFLLKMLEDVN